MGSFFLEQAVSPKDFLKIIKRAEKDNVAIDYKDNNFNHFNDPSEISRILEGTHADLSLKITVNRHHEVRAYHAMSSELKARMDDAWINSLQRGYDWDMSPYSM